MTTLALVETEGARPRIVRITGATAREVMRPIVDDWEGRVHRARIRHNGRHITLTKYADDGTITRRVTLTEETT